MLEMKASLWTKYKFLSTVMNTNLKDSIGIMIEQIKRGKFLPTGFETSFGDYSTIKPIIFKLDNGKIIKLIGKIDRVYVFQTLGAASVFAAVWCCRLPCWRGWVVRIISAVAANCSDKAAVLRRGWAFSASIWRWSSASVCWACCFGCGQGILRSIS